VWSVRTSKILRKYELTNKVVDSVSWGPADSPYCVLVATNEDHVHMFAPAVYSPEANRMTREMMAAA